MIKILNQCRILRINPIAVVFVLFSTKSLAMDCDKQEVFGIFAERFNQPLSTLKKECRKERLEWTELDSLYKEVSDKEFRDKLLKIRVIVSNEIASKLLKTTRNNERTIATKNSINAQIKTADGFISLEGER